MAARIDQRARIAYHEAGHAVIGSSIADRPQLVTIEPEHARGVLGRTLHRYTDVSPRSVQVHLAGYAAEHLAGYDAEHLCAGEQVNDFIVRVGYASLMKNCELEAVTGDDVWKAAQDIRELGAQGVPPDIHAELMRYYAITQDSLRAVWPVVKAVAIALLEHNTLDRTGLAKAFAGHDIYGPVFAVQESYGLLNTKGK